MKVSSRLDYAVKALVDLALHQATGPVPVKAIAKRQEIPLRYLEQLFNRLRRNGLVVAERGPRGGYSLGTPADQITVSDIVKSMEPNGLLTRPAPPKGKKDPAAQVWKRVEAAVQTTLKATTLEALVAQASDQGPSNAKHRYTFHI